MATFIAIIKLLPTIISLVQKAIALGELAELELRIKGDLKKIDEAFKLNSNATNDEEAAAAAGVLNDAFKK